jgi:arginyl-tRNA synthetase
MKKYILPLVEHALATLGAPPETEIVLESPRSSDHGDLATSVALGLARSLKRAPRQIAEEIVKSHAADERYVSSVEIAGPGFINFRFTPEFHQMRLDEVSREGEHYGRTSAGAGRSANVEYVSANPTGPLHPGHGRNAAIGDTVANLLSWTGYDVTREYYFNDAGNQMRNLARSIHARYCELLGVNVAFPDDGYHGDYLVDIARAAKVKFGDTLIEESEANLDELRAFGVSIIEKEQRTTLESIGVRHDVYFNETSLYTSGTIDRVVAALKEKGRTYEKDGAVWLRLEDFGQPDRVILRSNGEATYRLPDIAYHLDKLSRGYALIVDVFGADHIATAQDVKAALAMLGEDPERVKILLYQMITFLEDGQPVKMSKRSGKALMLDELVAELGADVVRFFFIMRGIHTHLEFDLDLAREQSQKNPVFYLQYAHARIAGILRSAASEGVELNENAALGPLTHPEELALIRAILDFPESIARAAREYEPQIVAEYLRELAEAFHKFYHECRILIDDVALRDARMRLVAATRTTLANGLRVLGISAPERM